MPFPRGGISNPREIIVRNWYKNGGQVSGDIQLFLAPEVVDDLGLGVSLLRVPDVVGELKIGDDEPSAFLRDIFRIYIPTRFPGNQGSANTTSRVYGDLRS